MRSRLNRFAIFAVLSVLLAACGGGSHGVPTLRGVEPSSAPAGQPGVTLTATGSWFAESSVVYWNGSPRQTTYVSPIRLTAAIPASDIAVAGTAQVTVVTPSHGGGTSAPIVFTINDPVPSISTLSPLTGLAGGDAISLTAEGTGFVATSVIRWNGRNLPTTYVSGIQLTGSVSHADLDRLGLIAITASNPPPMGGTSQPASFNVGGVLLVSPAAGDSKADGGSGAPVASASGRFIAFASSANNLVDADANGVTDVFLRDTCLGAPDCAPSTRRVSLSSGGAEGNQASGLTPGDPETGPAASGNGRYVAFVSAASNLVPGDTNSREDVFVRDTCLGAGGDCVRTTRRASIATDGAQASAPSLQPAISRDGRYVAFVSAADNLVAGDTNGRMDVFMRDTCAGADATCGPTTRRVSVAHDGTQGLGDSMQPALGASGRFVAYASTATSLVMGDTNDDQDVFLTDTCITAPSGCVATTTRVSLEGDGGQLFGANGYPALSGDARFVSLMHDSYVSGSLSMADPDWQGQIWLRDSCREAEASCFPDTYRLSVDYTGLEVAGPSREPAISGDGRFVTFQSEASTLIPGGVNPRDVANVYMTAASSRDQAAAFHYVAVDLTPLTRAWDVNNHGDIAGEASGKAAVLMHGGVVKTRGTLGGTHSFATAINDVLDIVGSSETPSGALHAFLQRNGVMFDLGALGGRNSEATDINEAGVVVGSSVTDTGRTHAFLYRDGSMQDLGTLGGNASGAADISDSGVVVGTSETDKELWPGGCCASDAFIYRNGAMVALGHWQRGGASSINESGDIVGSTCYGYSPCSTRITCYGWSTRGWVLDPNETFWITSAGAINDAGQVIVSADMDWPHASTPHATAQLLLDPVR